GVDRSKVEVHMLYGIRANEQRRLAREGFPVKTLVAYGTFWYPWYVRRLAERPANLLFAVRQIPPRARGVDARAGDRRRVGQRRPGDRGPTAARTGRDGPGRDVP